MSTATPDNSKASARPARYESAATIEALQSSHDLTKSEALFQAYDQYCQLLDEQVAVDADEFCRQHSRIQDSLARLIQIGEMAKERVGPAKQPITSYPQAKSHFGKLELIEELGRGAFSRVFLAIDHDTGDKQVVAKVTVSGDAETRIHGKLQHRNIVAIHRIERDPNYPELSAVCMPFEGRTTLLDVLDLLKSLKGLPERATFLHGRSQDPLKQRTGEDDILLAKGSYIDGVCYFAKQMADGLGYIQSHGILHQDLKPSNLLLTPDGNLLILDFNLSASSSQSNRMFGGTLGYMSPEQLRWFNSPDNRHAAPIDERTDHFSFGVIVYELLTKKHPFGPIPLGKTTAQLSRLLNERMAAGHVALAEACPDLDPELARLIDRCLSFDPSDRPARSSEMSELLDQYCRRRRKEFESPARPEEHSLGQTTPIQPSSKQSWSRYAVLFAISVLIIAAGWFAFDRFGRSVAPSPAPAKESELKQGEHAFTKGDYAEAVKHFSNALLTHKDKSVPLFARGRAYQMLALASDQKRLFHNSATSDFFDVEKLRPCVEINSCLAFSFLADGSPGIARDQFETVMRKKTKLAEDYNNYAYLLRRTGKTDEALTNINTAISLQPNLGIAYSNRLLIYQEMINKAKFNLPPFRPGAILPEHIQNLAADAMIDLKEVVAHDTESGEFYYSVGGLFAGISRYKLEYQKKALHCLKKAIELGCEPKVILDKSTFNDLRHLSEFQALYSEKIIHPEKLKANLLADPLRGELYPPSWKS